LRRRVPYAPRPARIRVRDGRPVEVNGKRVQAIRESWLIEEGWWSERPLRRCYFELLAEGRDMVVFCDLHRGGWFESSGR
jgi:hypothetical protein